MFGWRKRRDGFEWRQYVRTTILVRRERRRQRIDELRDAAIDNLKEVGRKGADAGAAGLGAAQQQARRSVGAAAAGAVQALGSLGQRVRPLVSGVGRIRAGSLGAAAAAVGAWASRALDGIRVTAGSWHLDSGLAQVALLIGAIIAGTGLYSWWTAPATAPQTASLADTTGETRKPPSQVSGRAIATTGDTLRIGDTTVRLSGIEAPDRGHACSRSTGKRWDCGQAAAQALSRHVRGKTVQCDVSGRDAGGLPLATCRIGADDIAAAMVSAGNVFAESGLFAAYPGLEAKAREAKAGIWSGGDALRPADYRAQRWEDARKAAPDGCPIKGQVTSGNRVYVLPWSPSYERAKVRSGRGERWFCSEKEAIAAGWKAHARTPGSSS